MAGGVAPAVRSDGPGEQSVRQPARPRIAYLMSRFPKLTETFVLDEILELERRGVQVEVFPLWREKEDVVHAEAGPLVERAHFAPGLNGAILRDNLAYLATSPGRYLGTLATLVRANLRSARYLLGALAVFPKACHFARRMQALGVRHVHAHFASHPAAAAFVASRLSGIPWSFTAHGSDLHREQAMLREKVRDASVVVTVSDYNRRFILDRLGERDADAADKIRVIHCGVDLRVFKAPALPAASGEADDDPRPLEIACIGTLHAVKGQGVLLEACARLAERSVPWRCHLVGDGPDRAALERRAAELGISDRVVFHGSCERARVRELLSQVDVGVAPSVPTRDGRREGIPVALMEAAASGLPLVASRISGIPELVRDRETGLLVEPNDDAGLAAALERLANEPETRRRLGAAARAHLEQAFRLDRNVATLLETLLPGAVR